MSKLCRVIFDDPERDSRIVAYADRFCERSMPRRVASLEEPDATRSSGAEAAGAPGQPVRGMG